jgi:hydroxypyruvate reductase/glycerate 2-kinase
MEDFIIDPTAPTLRRHALAIWQSAVDWVQPRNLIPKFLDDPTIPIREVMKKAPRILVVGAGKAGAAMSAALEDALLDCVSRMTGIVNVPADTVRPLKTIRLHPARPSATNQPTVEGVEGAHQILNLLKSAGPDDIAIGLWSGGGSALLPAPVAGISLADKQKVTRLLHQCGATINQMNAVRKHISQVKGGRLADAFSGRAFYNLIISDVIGDRLDVIASGPTSADPSSYANALSVLEKFSLISDAPSSVVDYLRNGVSGKVAETPKKLPDSVHNFVIGNNSNALDAGRIQASHMGYRVVNLGSEIAGDTQEAATALIGVVRGILARQTAVLPPLCLLSGGETTVTLGLDHGLGGRNQEFVLAAAIRLGQENLANVVVLSGGTDGEDGPTDAAGAIADTETLSKAADLGLSPVDFLKRHDAYHFFQPIGGLIKTGLTNTNVMDVRVVLIGE